MNLKNIAQALDIKCEYDLEITSLNTLLDSNKNELTFLENKKYINDLEKTKAGAVLVKKEFLNKVPQDTIALVCEEPYVALAKASKYFAPNVVETIGKDAIVGENTKVLDNVYIGKNTQIGNDCTIMPGVFIGDNVKIGNNTILYPNVCIYRDCEVGNDCIIHAGTIVGSDGFGFAISGADYIKIYQNGNVIIKNNVDIGSNCAIDRAAFKSTIIEDNVRLDNLVHIAHNCKLGKGTILTGQVGLSGSTILHEYVVMGGQSATAGHLEIAPFTTIAARGGVTKSITTPKKFWAGFPLMEHKTWLRLQGKISKLLKK
ncbi:UDP-3-O-(R-3-hydroxymyristoyl)-glucosamine N-acyltransferase [Malaciobacter marinus]|uniref:UDP-3-O-acylglucosamine N-acyltransferase n=1 Tax=Malaciobacter marinus TaxID=505249 RepID=A0A347TKQ1_9BACT|nr:UDP-3-O-(3-hydroxymyristoyl)glucosamine N-acyltransferase [Malaciobacter marinus]AXX87179.1 UDP-3-O-(R-3-hydroxymyristoyl)-glucosamine N-acyltransferase [Malaciobacter marinus]PHO12731.1 UDP-3-O-(3-hydroxymyristoyl)glucosamine N-acyltransferase [Malaciobacter marinus]PHO14842.1 UDP-3-O-(3-hydroxymyristoyl)glucosamine N-acyltransferase [Malaciobacter marinus]